MTSPNRVASWRLIAALLAIALIAAACGSSSTTASEVAGADVENVEPEEEVPDDEESSDEDEPAAEVTQVLRLGAIPDQEPERLQRTYGLLADYLEAEIPGLAVEYVPVTEYSSAVTGFSVGDLDAVWFGGLTGVQARLEVEGSNAILQRDIDEDFTPRCLLHEQTVASSPLQTLRA